MNEMIKRRKDEGFTLIELMIVIAVIGILAVVLMPKFGTIKTSAKLSGVETNFRSVTNVLQGGNLTDNASVATLLVNSFAGNNVITNPFSKSIVISPVYTTDASVIVANTAAIPVIANTAASGQEANYKGVIVVIPSLTNGVGTIAVYGCDQNGNLINDLKTVIQP